ncbi:MAG: hypothetical protein ABIF10_07380 [Candidatus Woesearchaeota archaeon]
MIIMPMNPFLDPVRIGVESFYALIILVLCVLVFLKTREIFELTKHKGIQFFRYAFIFFGFAYASRFVLYMIIISNNIVCEFCRYGRQLLPVTSLVVAYFSTMAILSLVYSIIWKRMKVEHFLIWSNIISLFVAVIAFSFRSPMVLSIVQLLFLVCASFIMIRTHKKDHSRFNTKALYLLIFAFWLLNLFILEPRRVIPFEIKVVFQVISVAVFAAILYKVAKWTK